MRRRSLWLLALAFTAGAAEATSLRYHYDFSSQWNGASWQGDWWRAPGKPIVPVVSASVLLPYGEELASVHFESGPEAPAIATQWELARQPRSICGGSRQEPSPRNGPLPAVFPAARLAPDSFVSTQYGYRVAHAALFPLLLATDAHTARRIDGGDLVIETRPGTKPALYRGLPADRAAVLAGLDGGDRAPGQLAVAQTYPISRAPARLDYLIIAPQIFIDDTDPDSLNRLLFEKNGRGVRSGTLAVETIQSEYDGSDLPAKIRAAITEYYQTSGIQYVLLVGNGYTSVPTKSLTVTLPDMTGSLPSDFYYACLDGDLNEDSPDLACEVAVGRAPVTTLDDLHVFVRKTEMMAALDANDPRLGNELNFGEELDATTLGGPLVDQLLTGGHAGTLSTEGYPATAAIRKLYETHTRNYAESEVVQAINDGQFYTVNHVGHADEALCMRITAADIPLLNNDIPFFAITQGCHPGNISVPNWASKLMNLPTGGAGAIIANSNYGFYTGQGSSDGPSNRFQLAFYDSYFRDGLTTLGKLHFEAKTKIAPQVLQDKTMLWVIYETNLLGDPELELKLPRH